MQLELEGGLFGGLGPGVVARLFCGSKDSSSGTTKLMLTQSIKFTRTTFIHALQTFRIARYLADLSTIGITLRIK